VIVADATLLAHLVIPGDLTSHAEAVYLKDQTWVVPTLCMSELRSVLSKYVLRDLLSIAEGTAALGRAFELIEGRELAVDSREVLQLVRKSRCSSYDCEYVSLAMELGVPLVTSDTQVLRAFPRIATSPSDFVQA
jgi:predicted nucleic acid-binding protein